MKRFAAVAFAVGVLAVAGRAQDAADAGKKIAGTYKVLSLSKGGMTVEKDTTGVKVVVTADSIAFHEGDKKADTATFKLDPSKTPGHIDLSPPGGKKTLLGIYQTKATAAGQELWIAFSKDETERPKDFSTDGPTTMVLKLLRPAAK